MSKQDQLYPVIFLPHLQLSFKSVRLLSVNIKSVSLFLLRPHVVCHSCLWSFTLECVVILRGEFLTMLTHFWSPEISCTGVFIAFHSDSPIVRVVSKEITHLLFQSALGWKQMKRHAEFILMIRLEFRSNLNIKSTHLSFWAYERHYCFVPYCILSFDLWVRPLPWASFPVWVLWCTIRLDFWVKAFPHSAHL